MLLSTALRLREARHQRAFEAACADPGRFQATVLRRILERNRDTSFGREHHFAAIEGSRDYASSVPIRDYEGFRPYVQRIDGGEGAVLTAEPVRMFTSTSGTTGEPKLIPVTSTWSRDNAAITSLSLLRALRDHPGLLDRKVLSIVSPAHEGLSAGGIPVGAMSGVTYRGLPRLIRDAQAIPYAVALIRDPEARYFTTMRLALAQDVSFVATPNASTLLRLAQTAVEHGETIVRAIRDGSLGIPMPATNHEPGTDRFQLEGAVGRLRPDPERAAVLERVLRQEGELLPGSCWPGLRLIACWLGGNAGVVANRLARFYGDVPMRDLGLLASEGRVTVPIQDGTASGVLAVHRSHFEFVEEQDAEHSNAPVLCADKLQEGSRYKVILTTSNGLYRYDLNDIVEVRGFYRRTPRVAFLRKGGDMANITGEKLHANQVLDAVRQADAVANIGVLQYRLIPDIERCRYDVLVECGVGSEGEEDSYGSFLRAFDECLCALNIEYASKRRSGRLEPPCLWVMRPGWAERQCRNDILAGKRELQHKWAVFREEWDGASRDEVMVSAARPG